jgi:hypothetical protein
MNTLFSHETNNPLHPAERNGSFKKRWLIIGLICLIPAMIFAAIISGNIYRFFFPYLDQDLTGQVTISSEWTEIVSKNPLHVERQIQMVVLDLDSSVKFQENGWGLILPDGSVVTPEVQLVDQDGEIYNLTQPSEWSNPSTGVKYREFSLRDLPRDKVYRAVRIRCDKPVRCNRIFWRNYYMWDVS